MPYHVSKSAKCPASKPWAVVKDKDGKVMGCHPSKEKANKQLAALYANEPDLKNNALNYWLAKFGLAATPAYQDARLSDQL